MIARNSTIESLPSAAPAKGATAAPRETISKRSEPVHLLLWAAALCVGLGGPLAAAAAPKPGKPVALIFPPWTSTADIIQRVASADGVAVERVSPIGVVLAVDLRPDGKPPFPQRLRAAGALLVFNGSAAAYLCGPPSK